MVKTKVFVGNLPFSIKEAELAQEFEKAGKVVGANIISRGTRSLGYGFVEFDNESDAQNAVKLLDKAQVGEPQRPINVEIAKPREEGAEGAKPARAPRRRGGFSGRGGARGGARGAERGERGGRGGARGGFRRRGPSTRRTAPKRDDSNRVPSKTTLFVANLPFRVDDEAFAKVFKDAGLVPKSATVARARSGRSKGFGFVEFEAEGDQKKAFETLNDNEVEGRKIQVKIALTEAPKAEGKPAEKKEEPKKEEKKEEKKTEKKEEPKKETSKKA